MENKVYFFDFDETIVNTDCLVRVYNKHNRFKYKTLTPAQYAQYNELTNDKIDFTDFDFVKSPKPAYLWKVFERVVNKYPEDTYIITARHKNAKSAIQNYIYEQTGKWIKTICVGSSDPYAKIDIMTFVINEDEYKSFYYADDSSRNCYYMNEAVEAYELELNNYRIQHVEVK